MHHAPPALPKQSSQLILVDAAKLVGLLLMGIWTMPEAVWAEEQPRLRYYEIVGDAIPDSLTGQRGTPRLAARLSSVERAPASSATRVPSPRRGFRATSGLTSPVLDPGGRKASSGFASSMRGG